MAPTLHEATGLSVGWGPNIAANAYLSLTSPAIFDTLTVELGSYRHRKAAFLGDDTAEIEFAAPFLVAEEWFLNGLGRHIQSRDEYLESVWQGFVNSVEIHIGDIAVVRGPLLDIANRVSVVYAEWDTTVSPPTQGPRTQTTIVEDEDSQRVYGIVEKVVSGGMVPQAQAEQIRDTYLEEHKQPEVTQRVSDSSATEGPIVRLNCLGYGHWLNAYIFSDATVGFQTLSDHLKDIITADPNGIFDTDWAEVADNPLLIYQYEYDYPTGFTAVQELVSVGDVSDNRYILKVLDDQRIYYQPAPTVTEYRRDVQNNAFYNIARSEIMPWQVEPGKWYKVDGFLVGTLGGPLARYMSDMRDDPRMVFIESLDYTAPFGLNVEGSKINRLAQKLAKLGMRGVDA